MNEQDKHSQDVNLKDLFFYLLARWKWFLLSMLFFGGLAWLHYSRTPFTYFRKATVIIKDPSNKTYTAGLDRYDNYINKVNVANEILQFRSKKLMQEVVKRVHADVNYKYKDGLRTNELYSHAPVSVSFPDATPEMAISFTLTVVDRKHVRISDMQGQEGVAPKVVPMNKSVRIGGVRMVVAPTSFCTENWMGKEIQVLKLPISAVASYYLANLGIRQEEDESSILTLSLKDASPARAEDVLNMLITVYNEDAIRDKNQVAVNTAEFINERLIIISRELGGVESELETYKRDNRILDSNKTASTYLSESRSSNSEALELETQQYRYRQRQRGEPDKPVQRTQATQGQAHRGQQRQQPRGGGTQQLPPCTQAEHHQGCGQYDSKHQRAQEGCTQPRDAGSVARGQHPHTGA